VEAGVDGETPLSLTASRSNGVGEDRNINRPLIQRPAKISLFPKISRHLEAVAHMVHVINQI